MIEGTTLTEILYLAASIAATAGFAFRSRRTTRIGIALLALGVLAHAFSFFAMHDFAVPPPSTGLSGAVSLTAWLGTLFFLAFLARGRLAALAVVIAPAAFLGVFFADLIRPDAAAVRPGWGHVHVLLASAGMGLLGVAGGAGLLFVLHYRSLKAKRRPRGGLPLPPLESLDRVNVLAISIGFLLLTLGVLTGVLWVQETQGRWWPGTIHATSSLVAWAIYAALVLARRVLGQGAHQSAWNAVAGFGVLLFAVVGVRLVA